MIVATLIAGFVVLTPQAYQALAETAIAYYRDDDHLTRYSAEHYLTTTYDDLFKCIAADSD